MKESQPSLLQACLDQSVLRAYDLGTIPEVLLEEVASHLAVCPSCESALEALHGEADALVQDLQRYLRADPPMPAAAGAETGVELQPAQPNYAANILAGGFGPLPRRFGAYQVHERLAVGGIIERNQLRSTAGCLPPPRRYTKFSHFLLLSRPPMPI